MKRCPFCWRVMDLISDRGALSTPHYACPGCSLEWIYGIHKLPNPDDLRSEAEDLEQIADELEAGDGLAGRLQGALS